MKSGLLVIAILLIAIGVVSLAYQGMVCEPSWVATVNGLAPRPDLTVYLRVPPEVAARRRRARGGQVELFESPLLLEQVLFPIRLVGVDGHGPLCTGVHDATPRSPQ